MTPTLSTGDKNGSSCCGSSGSILALIKDQLGPFIKRSLAVEFYCEGRLSPAKAAELAGTKSKWEMLMLLSEKGVPLDYTADDAKKDLKMLDVVLGR